MEIREILSTATSTQIPNHKTTKKKTNANNIVNNLRQGKLRNYKMFANPVFINPGRYKVRY